MTTPQSVIDLVRAMRKAQRKYFASRSTYDLEEARRLEVAVDNALAALLAPPSLFADQQEGPYGEGR